MKTTIFSNDPDGRNRRGEAYYAQLLGGRNPFGSLGRVGLDNLDEAQWQALPEFIRNQYYAGEDESGRRSYRLQSGILRNEDGSEFTQIGDMSSAVGEGDNSVLDWDQVRYDPQLGLITSAGNRRSVTSDAHTNGRLIAALTMAALGGYTALEGGLLGGTEAAAGSYPGYIDAIGNIAEGAWAGAPTTGALGGLTAATNYPGYIDAIGNATEGAWAGQSISGPLSGGLPFLETGADLPTNVSMWNEPLLSAAPEIIGGSGGLWGSLTNGAGNLLSQAMQNPIRTIGLLQTVGGLFQGSNGNRGNNGSNGNNGNPKGGSGERVPFDMGNMRGQYRPNPYTMQQLQNMRFAQPRGY